MLRARITKQRGVALIQVLLISALVMMLALQISFDTKSQLKLATGYTHKVNAEAQIYSAKSELLYTLITQNHSKQINDDGLVGKWNFYNAPFFIDQVEVRMQDAAGLHSIIASPSSRLAQQLVYLGMPESTAERFSATFLNWQAPVSDWQFGGVTEQELNDLGISPRHGPMQFSSEFEQIIKALLAADNIDESDLISRIKCCFSMYSAGDLNLLTAPEAIWGALVGPDYVERLSAEREMGSLDRASFIGITGWQSQESVGFLSSSTVLIEFKATSGDISQRLKLDVTLQPESSNIPFLIRKRS
ncbi:type II secretion system minor pseudopilin [Agarivorans gilvus]|uniref:Type II secretion system protein K n=1 Tax=Agarivorans gilvus TaxID=680279 RepID=A0ABQ1HYV1_9ALTE|nr:hypothetical protein [Agarivorans gilvus]GGA98874.1 hypothetical protein GCM10007414_09880 [Agarivorans gilvus]